MFKRLSDLIATSYDYDPNSKIYGQIVALYRKNLDHTENLSTSFVDLLIAFIIYENKYVAKRSMHDWLDILLIVTKYLQDARGDYNNIKKSLYELKERNAMLEEQSKIDDMYIDDSSAEIDSLKEEILAIEADASMWKSKYENTLEECKKAKHERDLLKEILHEKPVSKKYKVRQIAIIALALCRKAKVIPKNKKKIAGLFSRLTGSSQNTIAQNLCATYTDEEIEEIAKPLMDEMPELAEYLRENKFAG